MLEYPYILHRTAILLFLSSLLLSYLLVPLISNFAMKFKILDFPAKRKVHIEPTPLLGGLSIFFSFFITLCFFYLITSLNLFVGGPTFFAFGEEPLFWLQIGFFMVSAIVILLTGLLDDIRVLDFKIKLFAQILTAIIMVLGGISFNIFPWTPLNILFSIFWIVGFTNAFNLLDNMNGLSTGIAATIMFFFMVIAFLTSNPLLTLFFIIPAGALLGFLPHNFPKAKVFLGDTGSLFIGFSISIFSIFLSNHLIAVSVLKWHTLVPVVCLMLLPFLDTATVTIIRLINRQPIYVGDTNHLSHLLVRRGFSHQMAVSILIASCWLSGILSLVYVLK